MNKRLILRVPNRKIVSISQTENYINYTKEQNITMNCQKEEKIDNSLSVKCYSDG